MNNVSIIGRLVKDVEIRSSANGKEVDTFSIAVDDGRDHTSFYDCVAWEQGNIAKYLKKGTMVALSGRLQQSRWQAKDGSGRSKVEIIVRRIKLLGGRSEERQEARQESLGEPIPASLYDADIPF